MIHAKRIELSCAARRCGDDGESLAACRRARACQTATQTRASCPATARTVPRCGDQSRRRADPRERARDCEALDSRSVAAIPVGWIAVSAGGALQTAIAAALDGVE